MADSIDDLLAEVRDLTRRLESDELTTRQRQSLTHQKDKLQAKAKSIATAGRHPVSVENQIESLERRRSEINEQFIKPGYSEKRGGKNIQDPGAYSHNINKVLGEKYKTELDDIERQLSTLRSRTTE